MHKHIRPDQVELGMYVEGFNGSWLAHPFWKSGFVVETAGERAKLRDAGVSVIIDTDKGLDVADGEDQRPELKAAERTLRVSRPVSAEHSKPWLPARPSRIGVKARPAFGRADKVRATALAERSSKVVRALFEDHRLGRKVPASLILPVVDEIVQTLEENVSAFISVTRLKDKDDETYTHSVAVCALMISLARATSASPSEIQAMGLAGLLHDIGKVIIDDAILKKTGDLTDVEVREIRRHPELGHALLATDDLPPVALDVCLHHHERLDGSGYPFGLTGKAVSQAARMAAICDVYDALTSDRAYRKGIAPIAALAHMANARNEFDTDVLFQFMRGIGVFPPEFLVRLRSNRLALILPCKTQNQLPMARAFYSTMETSFVSYEDVALSDAFPDDQAIIAEDASNWFTADWATMTRKIMAGKPITVG